jgi:hypothetical protein
MGARRLVQGAAVAFLLLSSLHAQKVQVSVANPSGIARPNEPVVLPWTEIKTRQPNLEAGMLRLLDEEKRVVPLQIDDMDHDGTPDEVVFTADFAPHQHRTFTLTDSEGERLLIRRESFRTDAANWKRIDSVLQSVDDDDVPGNGRDRRLYRFDGVGWESDIIAYRLYLDERNAVDLEGKRKPGLHWNYIGASGIDYQLDADWGMDVLHVGPALGVGGIGFWVGDSVLKPETVDRERCRVIARGPVRAVVRVDYTGWNVAGEKVNISSLFAIYAGDRLTEHQIILEKGKSPATIVTGIVKHSPTKVVWNSEESWLYTLGPQSRANDHLLMALNFVKSSVTKKTEDTYNHLVLLKLEQRKPLRFLLSAVWQGETGKMWSEEEIQRFLRRAAARLNEPLEVQVE